VATAAVVLRSVDAPPQLEEIELRDPGPGEVLVRIRAAGICGTDLSRVERGDPRMPMVLGHEGAGVVERVGAQVSSVSVGDQVVLNLAPLCGRCSYCRRGLPNLCTSTPRDGSLLTGPTPASSSGDPIAVMAGAGCFAEHVVVSAASVLVVPDALPPHVAAVIGCAVITGFGAVASSPEVRPGTRGAILGFGGVGASALQAARLQGADEVWAIDPSSERRRLAASFGATGVVHPDEAADPLSGRELEDGLDWVVVAAGQTSAVNLGLRLLAPRGVAVVIGGGHGPHDLDLGRVVEGERVLRGSSYGTLPPTEIVPRIVDSYLSGELALDRLVTERIPLSSIEYALTAARASAGLRVVLNP